MGFETELENFMKENNWLLKCLRVRPVAFWYVKTHARHVIWRAVTLLRDGSISRSEG